MDGKEFTVSEVIDSFGINGHTWLMFVLLGLANIFDGYDFMVINVTNSYVAATFWPDAFQLNAETGKYVLQGQYSALMGSLTTWGLLGMVLGGATGGILSDRIGRKKMLTIAVLFYGVFTLPQAFANDVYFFAAFRLIAGFGVGSCIPVVTTCFSETIPSQHRGVFVTFGMAFMVAGWVLAGLIGNPIASNPESIMGDFTSGTVITAASLRPDGTMVEFCENWRLCYLIGALPIIYGIVLFFAMKETPHWFANSGQKEKACQALEDIARKHHAENVKYDPNLLVVPPKPANIGPNVLFSKKYIVATAAIWTTYFVGQFCVYGMNAWIPTWFQGVGYSAADSTNLQTWNNFAAILSNISVGFVSDRIGRKKNLAGSWIACIIAIILCSVLVQPNNMILCVVLMLLFGFCLNYAITAVQPLMPESYPTALRNTGVAWCQAFARFGGSGSSIVLGAIAANAIFKTAEGATNWSMVVLVLIVPFLLGFVCTLLFVRETGGKTMDQLAAEATTEDKSDTGTALFGVMMIVAAILFILCIVCPLVVNGWSSSPMALPCMTIGMLLPFIYFFIFATPQIKNSR